MIAAVTGPPVAAVLLVAGVFLSEWVGYRPLALPVGQNVAEAAAAGAPARVVALMRAGQDPNRAWRIEPAILETQGRPLTAIDAAVLRLRPEVVGLLLRRGVAPASRVRTLCLADAMKLPEVFTLLGATPAGSRAERADVGLALAACLADPPAPAAAAR